MTGMLQTRVGVQARDLPQMRVGVQARGLLQTCLGLRLRVAGIRCVFCVRVHSFGRARHRRW